LGLSNYTCNVAAVYGNSVPSLYGRDVANIEAKGVYNPDDDPE